MFSWVRRGSQRVCTMELRQGKVCAQKWIKEWMTKPDQEGDYHKMMIMVQGKDLEEERRKGKQKKKESD